MSFLDDSIKIIEDETVKVLLKSAFLVLGKTIDITVKDVIPKGKITIIDVLKNSNDVKKIINSWKTKNVIDNIAKSILYDYYKGEADIETIKKDILQEDKFFSRKVRVDIFDNFLSLFLSLVVVGDSWINVLYPPKAKKIEKINEIEYTLGPKKELEELVRAIVTWYVIRFIPCKYWITRQSQYIIYPEITKMLPPENINDTQPLYKIMLQNYDYYSIKKIKKIDRKILEYMYAVVANVFIESLVKGYNEILNTHNKLSEKNKIDTYVSSFLQNKFGFMILSAPVNIAHITSNYVKEYISKSQEHKNKNLQFILSKTLATYNIFLGAVETIWRLLQKIKAYTTYGIVRYFADMPPEGIESVLFKWITEATYFDHFVLSSPLAEIITSHKEKTAINVLRNIFKKMVNFINKGIKTGGLAFSYWTAIEIIKNSEIEKVDNIDLLIFKKLKEIKTGNVQIPQRSCVI
ncbi:MAG: hypothetical protein N3E37_04525 [Candidatus Micrarchaeota archaeon]|nr:hypothetical protein [Candidatus Micrarchaeota archaeon]